MHCRRTLQGKMAAQGTDKETAWVGGRDFIPHTNPQELTTAPTMMHDEIALPALRLILGDYSGANFKATNTLVLVRKPRQAIARGIRVPPTIILCHGHPELLYKGNNALAHRL